MSEQGRASLTETALRAVVVLGGLSYAIALFLVGPFGGAPSLGQSGFSQSNADVVIGVLLTGAGVALVLSSVARSAALFAVAVGVAWLAMVPARSIIGTDLLRGPGQASAALLGPALLGLVLSLAVAGQRSRRTAWWAATLICLAIGIAALRLASYDPFADPTCPNCAHSAGQLLTVSASARMLLYGTAAALTIIAAAGVIWVGISRLRARVHARFGTVAVVAGSVVVGVALVIETTVQFARAAQFSVSPGTDPDVVVELAKGIGGGLIVIGLVWLVTDAVVVRVRMRQLAQDIATATELGRLDRRLAGALNDQSLFVGYWFENESRYVSASGTPLEPPPADADRNKVTIERAHQPVAAIWHRRGIEPGTIRNELTASLLVAFDNERLQAVGMANLRALQKSRARLVAVQEEQRRQVERDLHDGLQQRLLAIVFDLRLARVAAERPAANARAKWLAGAEAIALAIVEEVRRLARGIYPAILSQAGLAAALLSLADEAPIPVDVYVTEPLRLSQPVETAIYQIVADALADAVRNGASDLSVAVRTSR